MNARACRACRRSVGRQFPRAPIDWTCADCRPIARPLAAIGQAYAEHLVRRFVDVGYHPSGALWDVLGIDEYSFAVLWSERHGRPAGGDDLEWLRDLAEQQTGTRPRKNADAVTALTMLAFDRGDVPLPDEGVEPVLSALVLIDDEHPALASEFVTYAIRRLRQRAADIINGPTTVEKT